KQIQQAHLQTKARSPGPQLSFCNASVKEGGVEARITRPLHHGVSMSLRLATANENHWEREGTTSVVPLKFISFTLQSQRAPSRERLLNAEVFVRSTHFQ